MTIAQGINSGQIADAGIVVGDLADGALAASVAGRLKMATGYFDTAAVLDKFAANSFTNANLLSLVPDGAFQADAATRALFGAGIWTAASFSGGFLSADVAGRALTADDYFTTAEFVAGVGGKFAAGCLDNTGLLNVVPANAFDSVFLLQAVADGAFAAADANRALFADGFWGATAVARAKFADDFFDSTMVSASGAGGKFAASVITTAGLAHLIADDAFTTAEFAAGAGGKFAAGALNNAGLVNLLADDVFTTVEFGAGAGGKFAAGALDNAGLVNLVADDAFTATEVSTVGAGGKFAAGAITAAGLAHLLVADAFAADAGHRALIATGFFDLATVDDTFATGSIGEDRLVASDIDARPLAQIADTAATATATAGADVVMKLVVEDVPTGNQDFVLPADIGACQVVDCWGIKRNGAGGAADTHQLQTGVGGAMSNAMVTNIAEDAIVRCGSLDEAASTLASGATLRVAVNDGAAGNTSLDVFVRVIKRA